MENRTIKISIIILLNFLLLGKGAQADGLRRSKTYKALKQISVYEYYGFPDSLGGKIASSLMRTSFPRKVRVKEIQKGWDVTVIKKILNNETPWYFVNIKENGVKISSGWINGDDFLFNSFREANCGKWYKDIGAIIYVKADNVDPSIIYVVFADIYYDIHKPAGGMEKFFFLIAEECGKEVNGGNITIKVLKPNTRQVYKEVVFKR